MVRFAADLGTDDLAELDAALDHWVDRAHLARQIAVITTIAHWDSIGHFYEQDGEFVNHNYYWYEETAADRMWLVPWDMDRTFGVPNPLQMEDGFGFPPWYVPTEDCEPSTVQNPPRRPGGCDPLLRRLVAALRPEIDAARSEFLETLFTEAAVNARLDRYVALIEDSIRRDPRGPSVAEWEEAIGQLRRDIPVLREAMLAELQR